MSSVSSEKGLFKQGELLEKTRLGLRPWLDGVDEIRTSFANLGFGIPSVMLSTVEALRIRGSGEKTYDNYLSEVLKEALFLPRGIWTVKARHSLPPPLRSPYLDFLEKIRDFNDAKDTASNVLDPNLELYVGLKGNATEKWRCHIAAIKQQKELELEKFRSDIDKSYFATSANKKIVDLILQAANDLGIECCLAENGKTARVVLRKSLSPEVSIYLEWSDMQALRKWGALQFVFVIQESGRKLWAPRDFRSWPFAFGLDGFIPGGDWYAWGNDHWDSVVLGVLAHLNFLDVCAV